MEAKELMIGDWCAYGVNCKGRVTALTEHLITLSVDGNEINGLYMLMPDMARPIPLTEEILAKNFGGYDHIDYDKEGRLPCYFVGNRRIFVDSVMDKGRCFYFCHKDDWAGLHDIEIHYVHQLQHLMRLCNIDKEISI